MTMATPHKLASRQIAFDIIRKVAGSRREAGTLKYANEELRGVLPHGRRAYENAPSL